MAKSVLEYLASLRRHGHTPEAIVRVKIGRTEYSAGRFIQATDGRVRLALTPCLRTDWVTRDSVGPTPSLLPPSYVRNRNIGYADAYGNTWFISGWNDAEGYFWLDIVTAPSALTSLRTGKPYPVMAIDIHEVEPFDCAMRLASPEVLARIEAEASK